MHPDAELLNEKSHAPLNGEATPRQAAARFRHLLAGEDAPRPPGVPQDFRDGLLNIGVRLQDQTCVVRSDRDMFTVEEFGGTDYGLDSTRFSKSGVTRFLNGERVDGAGLIHRLEQFVQRFVVLPQDGALLLAVWILGTYVHQVFEYYPYLVLRSPEKRCGKTRVLDLISLLAFNAHPATASPTEAQIFREPREDGGVQVHDELEGMTKDKERWSALLSVLNVGFQRGHVVTRYKKTARGQEKELFPAYAPRAIASISALEATLEDRAIMLMMQRKQPGAALDRFSPRHLERTAKALRDNCCIVGLVSAADISGAYQLGEFAGLRGIDDRAMDLWEPLVAITAVADAATDSTTLTDRLTVLARRMNADRQMRAGEEIVPVILETMREVLGAQTEAKVPTAELIERLEKRLGWEKLTPKGLGNRLHPLGLRSQKWRDGDKTVRGYVLVSETLEDLERRYVPSLIPPASATNATSATQP